MAQKLRLVSAGTPGRRPRGEIDYSKFDDREQAATAWLQQYNTNNLVCRSQRHDFPVLVPGKPLPRGCHTRQSREGMWQLVDFCRRCGRKRVTTLLPGNIIEPGLRRSYTDPKGYAKPKGLPRVSMHRAFGELLRRMAEEGALDPAHPERLAIEGQVEEG